MLPTHSSPFLMIRLKTNGSNYVSQLARSVCIHQNQGWVAEATFSGRCKTALAVEAPDPFSAQLAESESPQNQMLNPHSGPSHQQKLVQKFSTGEFGLHREVKASVGYTRLLLEKDKQNKIIINHLMTSSRIPQVSMNKDYNPESWLFYLKTAILCRWASNSKSYLSLLNSKITDVYYHTQLPNLFSLPI